MSHYTTTSIRSSVSQFVTEWMRGVFIRLFPILDKDNRMGSRGKPRVEREKGCYATLSSSPTLNTLAYQMLDPQRLDSLEEHYSYIKARDAYLRYGPLL